MIPIDVNTLKSLIEAVSRGGGQAFSGGLNYFNEAASGLARQANIYAAGGVPAYNYARQHPEQAAGVGAGMNVAGAILLLIPGMQPVGFAIMGIGSALSIGAGFLVRPPRMKDWNQSPTYSIDTFTNPSGPDALIPLVYGTHRVVPVMLQEFVSPLAEAGGGVNEEKQQGLSMLMAVAKCELSDVTDIRLNGTKVLGDEQTDSLTKGNGSRKVWTTRGTWAYLPSLQVAVNGTNRANVQSSGSAIAPPTPTGTITIGRNPGETILTNTIRVYLGTEEQDRTGSAYPWTVRILRKNKVRISFGSPPSTSLSFRVTYDYLGNDDLLVTQDGKGRTTLEFGTAPANNATIVATYRVANFPRLKIEWRRGTRDQEPIDGFNATRQSYSQNLALEQDSAKTYSTDGRKVNDLWVGIVAPSGFVYFTDDGDAIATRADVGIKYVPVNADGSLDSRGWRILYHVGGGEKPKPTFYLKANTLSRRVWEVGLRATLQELVDAGIREIGGFDLEEDLALLREGTALKVQVTRKDRVMSENSTQWQDRITFGYVTEVQDVGFVYPGTALLALRAQITASIQGTTPMVEAVCTRAPLYDPRTGEWDGDSNNPALAAYDLLTSGNGEFTNHYGSRGHFTDEDVYVGTSGSDAGSIWAFADWCEGQATTPGGGTENRHQLDLVLDTPMSLIEIVGDICAQARVMPVCQGVLWKFPIDKDGTASFAFTESADPANANIVSGSLQEGPEPLGNTPTDVELDFFDAAADYLQQTIVATREDLADGAPRNVIRASGVGIARMTEAERYTKFLLESGVNNAALVTWEAHPGALSPEAGDIVSVTSYVPGGTAALGWSAQKVRVLSIGYESPAPDSSGAPTLPSVHYVGRIMKDKPYSVSVTRSSPPTTGDVGRAGPGTSGGNTRSQPLLEKIKSLRARVQP